MGELLITILLTIPSPTKMVGWTLNEIPTQIQLIHKDGVEVSYHATPVSCEYRPQSIKEMTFVTEQASKEDKRCYLIYDLGHPTYVRHPNFWLNVE